MAAPSMSFCKVWALMTGSLSALRSKSPVRNPAFAAGVPEMTCSMRNPII